MTLTEISSCRLFSQKIASTEFASAKEVVGWMGAMQAQDFAMAKWAVGLRLLYPTNLKIETALNKGEIIRTHLMRPTWHFVASDDIYWLLDLTANKIKSSMKSRDKELELSEAIYTKCNNIIWQLLDGGIHLSREELAIAFNSANMILALLNAMANSSRDKWMPPSSNCQMILLHFVYMASESSSSLSLDFIDDLILFAVRSSNQ